MRKRTRPNLSRKTSTPTLERRLAGMEQKMTKLATKEELQRLSTRVDGLSTKVDSLATKLETTKQEILNHFDAAVENIEDSLRGANADEISLLQDHSRDHDRRIRRVEQRVGLR